MIYQYVQLDSSAPKWPQKLVNADIMGANSRVKPATQIVHLSIFIDRLFCTYYVHSMNQHFLNCNYSETINTLIPGYLKFLLVGTLLQLGNAVRILITMLQ